MKTIPKPQPGEYAPYAIMYIDLLPDDGRVLQHLTTNLQAIKDVVNSLPTDKLDVPHEPGEWTVKEILLHIIDTERILAYRALRFARHDSTDLPGFDQDAYVPESGANQRSIETIWAEYDAVRNATLTLFSHLDDDTFTRSGFASTHTLSVRGAAYFIAGHEVHHLESIEANYLRR